MIPPVAPILPVTPGTEVTGTIIAAHRVRLDRRWIHSIYLTADADGRAWRVFVPREVHSAVKGEPKGTRITITCHADERWTVARINPADGEPFGQSLVCSVCGSKVTRVRVELETGRQWCADCVARSGKDA